MIDEIIEDATHRMDQAIVHTQGELNKVRTGRANPEMFNSLFVDYYGNKTPLNQVATVSVPEPRLITLQPYEKTLIPIIEKAIMKTGLSVKANIMKKVYQTGRKVVDNFKEAIRIVFDEKLGKWNYRAVPLKV